MTADERTPLPAQTCPYHAGCVRRIELLEGIADTVRLSLVETIGQSGRNGRLGTVEQEMKELRLEVDEHRKVTLRVVLWVLAAASGGSGIAHALLQALGG